MSLFGDHKQNIYYSLGSTTSYLLNPLLFEFQVNNWKMLNLSKSFRCSQNVSELVNELMNEKYINTDIDINDNIELIYYKMNNYKKNNIKENINNYIFLEDKIIELLNIGYKPDQIMILFPSFKYKNVKIFINKLQDTIPSVNLTALTNINIDARSHMLLKNKIIISTIHSSKGLERDVVILLPFNESFNDMIHNYNRFNCSNLLYVALTRAKKKLILYQQMDYIEGKKKPILPLLIKLPYIDNIIKNIYYINCDINEKDPEILDFIKEIKHNKQKDDEEIESIIKLKFPIYFQKLENYLIVKPKVYNRSMPVKEYLSFKNIEYFNFYTDKINILNLASGTVFNIKKEIYNENRNIYEDVSSVLGIIIPMYIEYFFTNNIKELKYLLEYKLFINEKNIDVKINKLAKMAITNCINKETMFSYKLHQVPSNIINSDLFLNIVKYGCNIIKQLNKDKDYELHFEHYVYNKLLRGSIDLLMKNISTGKNDIIIEFKLTSINDIANYIQLLTYGILYCEQNQKKIEDVSLIYINLSNSSIYLLTINEHYETIKDHIYNTINNKEENKTMNNIIDYIKFIKIRTD
jgi:hypothetical protein